MHHYILNQYFQERSACQEDSNALPLQDAAAVEPSLAFSDMPGLDLSPFDDENKIASTFETVLEDGKQTQSQLQDKEHVSWGVYFGEKTVARYLRVRRGGKNDTVELNINFRTLIGQFFRDYVLLNELNEYQLTLLRQFLQRVPSLKSLMLFLQKDERTVFLREKCRLLFSSRECIARILGSRCKMATKLVMVKFVEKMRLNVAEGGKGRKWKDSSSRQR